MILEIILLALILFFAFIFVVAYKMVTPPREIKNWTPKDAEIEYEEVTIPTSDGLKLKGWWIDRGSEETIIPLHGYTSSRWGFYIIPMIETLAKSGYNVLAFDFRAHGESEGKYTTVGDKELIDLISAIDWLKKEKPSSAKRIGLIGYSMGAMVAIRALAEDERVCCAVADSPPMYLDKTGARSLKYFANLPEWLYYFVKPISKIITGAKEVNPIGYADRVKKPLLLIAGKKDPIVKVEEIKEFYERNKKINPDVELWITEAAHVRTIQLMPEEYKEKVLQFFEKYL
ncbi:alpha/beta hydrolase [Thermococcus litoralis DSM 5473]|uniref:Alpha/beta hydrolase n=1 Tax=Thermococcus litoralis (strain ATCC 51850 / DSM 5473 / JCM 8560 / NS-C) TaxID=523849 RepID=H3ZMC6_THELN|nr:alpha/beta fold hydrolase [Thermococcus litoralis]EHR78911.1 alpha/beta hydrolase [Thermococcus litoralis DSM 5473]